MIQTETYQSFNIGSENRLSENQKQTLVREFEKPPKPATKGLSGRTGPHMANMNHFGPVVIKHYYRGGILRYINRKAYLNLGRSRCRAEYETLALVRQIGVNAPMPLAFATRPVAFAFYHAWLVTKKIPGAETLADLALSAPPQAEAALPEVASQINRLIQHHVLHVDLHPGNILVDQKGRIHLLDFDQAKTNMRNKEKMTRYYRKRWTRSIIRHQLPTFLEAGLIQKIGF